MTLVSTTERSCLLQLEQSFKIYSFSPLFGQSDHQNRFCTQKHNPSFGPTPRLHVQCFPWSTGTPSRRRLLWSFPKKKQMLKRSRKKRFNHHQRDSSVGKRTTPSPTRIHFQQAKPTNLGQEGTQSPGTPWGRYIWDHFVHNYGNKNFAATWSRGCAEITTRFFFRSASLCGVKT